MPKVATMKNPKFRSLETLFLFWVLLLFEFTTGQVNPKQNHGFQWQVLTRSNFSSQIRAHPYLLLLVTVPWSGESRSLMREVVELSNQQNDNFGGLRLMVVYNNTEKMLADVLGASKGITFFCYRHSVAYKYRGRLRAQNILSSVHHLMMLPSEELPMKSLNTEMELQNFIHSTDKAVILFEFCGWSPILLAKSHGEGNMSTRHGDDSSKSDINQENIFQQDDDPLASDRKKSKRQPSTFEGNHSRTDLGPRIEGSLSGNSNPDSEFLLAQKQGMTIEKLTCAVEKEPNPLSWLDEFTWGNESSPAISDEYERASKSCTPDEFERYKSFLTKFTKALREYILPPERQRFGLITRRSLISSLGVENPGSWALMVQFVGCPNCSEVFVEGNDFENALVMCYPFVKELEGEAYNTKSKLPAKEPSMILFLDRSSESSEIREKSEAALSEFKQLALHTQLLGRIIMGRSASKKRYIGKSEHVSDPLSPFLMQLVEELGMSKFKERMTVKIVGGVGNIELDNIATVGSGTSAHDILANLLQHKGPPAKQKVGKISLLAKEAGFQLLSNDIEIKLSDVLEPEISEEMVHGETTQVISKDDTFRGDQQGNTVHYRDSDFSSTGSSQKSIKEEPNACNNVESENGACPSSTGEDFGLVESSPEILMAKDEEGQVGDNVEEESPEDLEQLGENKDHYRSFEGSFFFSDGGYQLLRAFTGDSIIPSVVILDPIRQQHYVFPRENVVEFSSLSHFLDAFTNGSFPPYQRSQSQPPNLRETPWPPFVNQDFHEADAIPRVTTDTFSGLVLGFNLCDGVYGASCMNTQNLGPAWRKDVLVLFSNSWCGFCQRMELVVREVYRAFKGYMNVLLIDANIGEDMIYEGYSKDAMLKDLPSVYSMDCTLNDCSTLLKALGQRDLYPSLILFPAEKKDAIYYEGDMSVANVIDFIAAHGSISGHLLAKKGILWSESHREGRTRTPRGNFTSTPIHNRNSATSTPQHEVVLNTTRLREDEPDANSDIPQNSWDNDQHIEFGSILVATEKLLNAPPFESSMILIVKADQTEGFQGLIVNKHIKWEFLPELDDGFRSLKSAPLSFGGPLIVQGLPLMSLARYGSHEGYAEILPGFYFGGQWATSNIIQQIHSGNQTVEDFWFFLGYASWGWQQLFNEIAEGSWRVESHATASLEWPEV